MPYTVPERPKIYHIVHEGRLPSIIQTGGLISDALVQQNNINIQGTTIGMGNIKQRRLGKALNSYPDLKVGECVPFYFCPRSIMLYMISQGSTQLDYQGGQEPILHLEADLYQVLDWARDNNRRWAFTLSNAGSNYFEDRNSINHLCEINWDAVDSRRWQDCKDGKQAEFLVEDGFPWNLVERIGVCSTQYATAAARHLNASEHKPLVEVIPTWYY